MIQRFLFLVFVAGTAFHLHAQGQPIAFDKAQFDRGEKIYTRVCWVCHQTTGLGAAGVFPPLAGSDYLMQDKERVARNLIQGLTGPIVVKGQKFNSVMPASGLSNEEIADVVTYVRNSWGNKGDSLAATDVQKVRGKRQGAIENQDYAPLPTPPAEFTLREVIRMPDNPVRFAGHMGDQFLYILCARGDVWRLDPKTADLRQILWGDLYLDKKKGDPNTVGITLDNQNRFYIVANQQDSSGPIVTNWVTIFRTSTTQKGDPLDPKPWYQTNYPWGVGPYNHGVNNISVGPDGYLYVSSGSRTDGGEQGMDAHYWKGGETNITACMWRFDLKKPLPQMEIFARGLRNSFGFTWNDKGEMFATENGPDADAPEELNWIQKDKFYGFPYRFSNWTKKAYDYTPDLPAGLEVTLPVANLGPDGGFAGEPMYTFKPHSSPAGIVFLGNDFPEKYRGSFFVARVGNMLPNKDSGFDVLQVRLEKGTNGYNAHVNTILSPLGRPIDLFLAGHGIIYLAEYTRGTSYSTANMMPGRILELKIK